MAQKAITIYTPPEEAAHIFAEDEAQHNRALLGNGGSGIEDVNDLLACTKINDNTVRLASGSYANQGFEVIVPSGFTEDLSVESGVAGQYRRDLVVADFTKGGGAVSDVHIFTVIKGTPAASAETAADPALIADDLIAGGTRRQEAIYRLTINGSTLASITRIAPFVGNFYA